MKKAMKRVGVILLACVMVLTMVACSTTLKGTYTSKSGLIEQKFIFKEDNRVAVSAFGIDVEGDYEIKDGEITITYSLLGLSYDWVKSFEKDGDSIFIDGTEFVKE